MNVLLTYAIMLDSFILADMQFVITLTELQELLSQELQCLCSKTTTVLSEWTVSKTMDVSYIFIALEIKKKYILYRNVGILYINVCILYRNVHILYRKVYTGCPRRNVPDFGTVFLMLNYTDITQNTYIQS